MPNSSTLHRREDLAGMHLQETTDLNENHTVGFAHHSATANRSYAHSKFQAGQARTGEDYQVGWLSGGTELSKGTNIGKIKGKTCRTC